MWTRCIIHQGIVFLGVIPNLTGKVSVEKPSCSWWWTPVFEIFIFTWKHKLYPWQQMPSRPGREVCSFLRKSRSRSQVWIIAVRLFLFRCCVTTVALCNSRLRHLCVLPASPHSMLKRFPPGLRSNKSNDFYCFIEGAPK